MTGSGTGIDGLREMIEVPDPIGDARWFVQALGGDGQSMVPGPTDLWLLALLRPGGAAAWAALEELLGPAGAEQTIVIPAEAAAALFGHAPAGTGEYPVKGPGYDARALSSVRFRVDGAVRAGGGVLVSAASS